MKVITKEKCTGCFACASICPKKCIEMKEDLEGFAYPKIRVENCINCGLCEKVCPLNKKTAHNSEQVIAYGINSNNEEERENSSSGGVFSLLARLILNQNGIVFGATMSNDYKKVFHTSINNVNDLFRLRGSKYLQSQINNTYVEVKEFLESGKIVLFVGTPCQVEGLLSFLKRDYDNLYTLDFICHGVPSHFAWEEYVNYRERKAKSNIKEVFFRYKKPSWSMYSIKLKFENGKTYEQLHIDDLYFKTFMDNYTLRPSCYDCKFKKINRKSDITLADLWGAQDITPKLFDDLGTSLIIIHSKKGKKIINEILDDVNHVEINLNDAIHHNNSLIKSEIYPEQRSSFYLDLSNGGFDFIAKKYYQLSLKDKIIGMLKIIKRKLLSYKK